MTIALGLFAAVAWAAMNTWLVGLGRTVGAATAAAWMIGLSFVATLGVALATGGFTEIGRRELVLSVGAGLLELTSFVSFLRATHRGSLAVIAPITALEGGLAAVLAVGLGESLPAIAVPLLMLAVLGGVLAAMEPGGRSAAGVGWAVVCACAFACMLVLYGHAPAGLDAPEMLALARGTGAAVIMPVLAARGELGVPRRLWPLTVWVALGDTVAFIAAAAATQRGPVSVAAVASAQYAAFSVLVGVFVLKERVAARQWLGIAIALIATSLLAGVT